MHENAAFLKLFIHDLAEMLKELGDVFGLGVQERVHNVSDISFEFEVVHSGGCRHN